MMQTRFIILDDYCCANTVNMLALKKALPKSEVDIISFSDPAAGVEYLRTDYMSNPVPSILLLDISMPVVSGWQVLEEIEKLPLFVTRHLIIYILSVSVHPSDILKASSHPLVQGFLPKPLSRSLPMLLSAIKNGDTEESLQKLAECFL